MIIRFKNKSRLTDTHHLYHVALIVLLISRCNHYGIIHYYNHHSLPGHFQNWAELNLLTRHDRQRCEPGLSHYIYGRIVYTKYNIDI